jgi:hypothetical protein
LSINPLDKLRLEKEAHKTKIFKINKYNYIVIKYLFGLPAFPLLFFWLLTIIIIIQIKKYSNTHKYLLVEVLESGRKEMGALGGTG